MATETLSSRADEFIRALEKLRDDRGAMASLRRALSPALAHYAWPYLVRWCKLDDDRSRIIHATVAGCFALHPVDTAEGNIGTTFRLIAGGTEGLESFEGRFRRLLSCSRTDEVCERVVSVVRAGSQRQIPVNYRQLFMDLCLWSGRSQTVKVRWAQEFWRPTAVESQT